MDKVIASKATIKQLKAAQENDEAVIIDHVRPQQETYARDGNFSKSLLVGGTDEKRNLTYVTSDKFSIPKSKEIYDEMKSTIGQKKFDELFEMERTIQISEEMQKNTKFISDIIALAKKAGVSTADAFVVTDTLIAKPGMDEKQFSLPREKLVTLLTLIRQNKPALK